VTALNQNMICPTIKRAVFYLRVSTQDQTTANQERELREIAGRMGCDVVKVYRDHGISGAKGRDKRPAFDALCRAATRREFDVVMAWSVDRLGCSLQDLVAFLSDLHAGPAGEPSVPPSPWRWRRGKSKFDTARG
jgi:DNA invertase Pin-like site-specific DNA recombinase